MQHAAHSVSFSKEEEEKKNQKNADEVYMQQRFLSLLTCSVRLIE